MINKIILKTPAELRKLSRKASPKKKYCTKA
jgi:hypothetical protein